MKRRRFRGRRKYFPVLFALAGFLFLYLLIHIMTPSLSGDLGQAEQGAGTALLSKLGVHIFESGSSLFKYQKEGKKAVNPFPLNMISEDFAVHNYTKDRNSYPVLSQNYYPSPVPTVKPEEETAPQLGITAFTSELITRDYILTNGAVFHQDGITRNVVQQFEEKNSSEFEAENQLPVDVISGEFYYESDSKYPGGEGSTLETLLPMKGTTFTLEQLKNKDFFVKNFYIIDSGTKITESLFDAEMLLSKDMKLNQGNDAPQILIYHTHSKEAFLDSREDVDADTVVGIGKYLKEILEKDYGYNVIHDTTCYDVVDGKLDRNLAYNYARAGIENILNKYPSIEVIIDLHRDGVAKRSTVINGEETAQIMLFNGLCRDNNGPIERLENPYLADNLAFSLKLQLKAREMYPGLFYRNYLNAYRYNMHLRKKSILMELGTHKNTLQSAKNAMAPFAEILDSVLKGE